MTHFNPRSPCGERLPKKRKDGRYQRFQSTRPGWGATASPHIDVLPLLIFQSTLPVWGATKALLSGNNRQKYFNPRSPCGERQRKYPKIFLKKHIDYTYCTKSKMIDSIYFLFLLNILSYFPKIRCEHPWKTMSAFPSHHYKIIGSSGR